MAIKRKEMQKLVLQLLEKAGIRKPPVDPEAIGNLLGIQLRRQDLGDISGVLYKEGEEVIVGVNSNHHINRQRFTIAHEIGHLLLHQHNRLYVDKMFPVWLRSKVSSEAVDRDEIEANSFAAELLMPAHMLQNEPELQNQAIDYEYERTIDAMATRYGVSTQAMTFRLINLGLIKNEF